MKKKADNRTITKRDVRTLLERRELDKLEQWAENERNALTKIMPFLYERDELLRWRAIEAMGRVAEVVFERAPEAVRETVRKLLWSMNDESGSIGWHAPEAVGEILYNVPALLEEYGIILASHLDKSPFERGTHWAVMRMASANAGLFSPFTSQLEKSLENPDPYIRTWATVALGLICPHMKEKLLDRMKATERKVHYYDFLSGKIISEETF